MEIPLDFCTLKEIHKGTNDTLIIHIQDAHSNFSGQDNLSKTLDSLMTKYGVSLILVEGSSKDVSLDSLKEQAPSKEVLHRVARSFLVQGKIQGEEYLNLTSSHPMKILGIEDRELYLQSLSSYSHLATKRQDILNYLGSMQRALEKLKLRLYPQELLDYEKPSKDNADGFNVNIKELLELIEESALDLNDLPNLQRLKSIQIEEEAIDFHMANLEQASLIEKLIQLQGKDSLEEALRTLNKTKNSRTSQYSFFQDLLQRAKAHHLPLSDYPSLVRYGETLKDFQSLDLDQTLKEITQAEDRVYKSFLARQPDSLLIRSIDRYLKLLDIAYRIQMSTQDFATFRANEKDFATADTLAFVNRKLSDYGLFQDLIAYNNCLEQGKEDLKDFYESVNQRDLAFIQNTQRILKEQDQKTAILISGGYHTPHLKELFQEQGYSYSVLAPHVTSATNQANYERLLLEPIQKKTKTFQTIQGETKAKDKPLSSLEEDILIQKKVAGVRVAGLAASGSRLGEFRQALGGREGVKGRGSRVNEISSHPAPLTSTGARLATKKADEYDAPSFSMRRVPHRYDSALEEGVYELQQDVRRMVYKILIRQETGVEEGYEDIEQGIQRLFDKIPVEFIPNQAGRTIDYLNIRDVRNVLASERIGLYRQIVVANENNDKEALGRLNLEAIRLNAYLLKIQVYTAQRLLLGDTPLKDPNMRIRAVLWALQGAAKSAANLRSEVHYRIRRMQASRKKREYWTLDSQGRAVRLFRPAGFDIEFLDTHLDESAVSIRQRRWRNARTVIHSMRTDFNQSRMKDAIEKTDFLLGLYTVNDEAGTLMTPTSYQSIVEQLSSLRAMMESSISAQGPPTPEEKTRFRTLSEELISSISHPKISAWQNVLYKNRQSALRSQNDHTIENNIQETLVVLRNQSNLEYFSSLLEEAIQKAQMGHQRPLSNRTRAIILSELESLQGWVDAGFVRPKQSAAMSIHTAAKLLSTPELGKSQLQASQEQIKNAITSLDQRLRDLENIALNVKRRAASLFEEDFDRETHALIADLIKQVSSPPQAKDAVSRVRALLSAVRRRIENHPEPGYKRIARLIDALLRSEKPVEFPRMLRALMTMQGDIEHKNSYRLNIIQKNHINTADRVSKIHVRYFVPGTKLGTMLGRLEKNLDLAEDFMVRAKKAWSKKSDLTDDTLNWPVADDLVIRVAPVSPFTASGTGAQPSIPSEPSASGGRLAAPDGQVRSLLESLQKYARNRDQFGGYDVIVSSPIGPEELAENRTIFLVGIRAFPDRISEANFPQSIFKNSQASLSIIFDHPAKAKQAEPDLGAPANAYPMITIIDLNENHPIKTLTLGESQAELSLFKDSIMTLFGLTRVNVATVLGALIQSDEPPAARVMTAESAQALWPSDEDKPSFSDFDHLLAVDLKNDSLRIPGHRYPLPKRFLVGVRERLGQQPFYLEVLSPEELRERTLPANLDNHLDPKLVGYISHVIQNPGESGARLADEGDGREPAAQFSKVYGARLAATLSDKDQAMGIAQNEEARIYLAMLALELVETEDELYYLYFPTRSVNAGFKFSRGSDESLTIQFYDDHQTLIPGVEIKIDKDLKEKAELLKGFMLSADHKAELRKQAQFLETASRIVRQVSRYKGMVQPAQGDTKTNLLIAIPVLLDGPRMSPEEIRFVTELFNALKPLYRSNIELVFTTGEVFDEEGQIRTIGYHKPVLPGQEIVVLGTPTRRLTTNIEGKAKMLPMPQAIANSQGLQLGPYTEAILMADLMAGVENASDIYSSESFQRLLRNALGDKAKDASIQTIINAFFNPQFNILQEAIFRTLRPLSADQWLQITQLVTQAVASAA